MFTVEAVEGLPNSDVVLMLEDSSGERTTLYSSTSEGGIDVDYNASRFIDVHSNRV